MTQCFLPGHGGDDNRGQCYKTYYSHELQIFVMRVFAPGSLSSLVYCLWARPGAYPIVKHQKGVSLGQALAHVQTLYYLARGKHSSLLLKLVTYDRKKFNNIGPSSMVDWTTLSLTLLLITLFFGLNLKVNTMSVEQVKIL